MQFLKVLILLPFGACSNNFKEDELFGKYSPIGYKNTYDTIELRPLNVYHRKVYDRNNKLVLEMDGKWKKISRDEIDFHSFFLNLDRDVSKFPELLADTTGGVSTTVESHFNAIKFCVGYLVDENCYQKVK